MSDRPTSKSGRRRLLTFGEIMFVAAMMTWLLAVVLADDATPSSAGGRVIAQASR